MLGRGVVTCREQSLPLPGGVFRAGEPVQAWGRTGWHLLGPSSPSPASHPSPHYSTLSPRVELGPKPRQVPKAHLLVPTSEIPPSNLTSPGTAQHLGVGRLGQGASHDPSLRGGQPGGEWGRASPWRALARWASGSPFFTPLSPLPAAGGLGPGQGLTPRDTGPPLLRPAPPDSVLLGQPVPGPAGASV